MKASSTVVLLAFTTFLAVGIANAYVIQYPENIEEEGARVRRSPQGDDGWNVSYDRDGEGGTVVRGYASRRIGTPDGSVSGEIASHVERVEGGLNDGYQGAGASASVRSSF